VSDSDIAQTVAAYTPGTRPSAGEDGLVVIDLTDPSRQEPRP
jgi:hypothetical protein